MTVVVVVVVVSEASSRSSSVDCGRLSEAVAVAYEAMVVMEELDLV